MAAAGGTLFKTGGGEYRMPPVFRAMPKRPCNALYILTARKDFLKSFIHKQAHKGFGVQPVHAAFHIHPGQALGKALGLKRQTL